jgi:hypothetical protein
MVELLLQPVMRRISSGAGRSLRGRRIANSKQPTTMVL